MVVEIDTDDMYYQTITRSGKTVDSVLLKRREVQPAVTRGKSLKPRSARSHEDTQRPAQRMRTPPFTSLGEPVVVGSVNAMISSLARF